MKTIKFTRHMLLAVCFCLGLSSINDLRGMITTNSSQGSSDDKELNLENGKIEEEEIKKLREEITKNYPDFNPDFKKIFRVDSFGEETVKLIDGSQYLDFMLNLLQNNLKKNALLCLELDQKITKILMYYLQHKYRVFGNDKWLKSILGESLANPENPTSWDPAYKGILSISYWELKKLLTNGENQTSGMEELEKLIKKGYWVTFPKTIKDKDVNLELKSKYLNRTFCLPLRLSFAYCKSIGDKSIVKLTKRYPNLAGIDLCGCRRVTNVSIKAIEENCKHMKCIFTYATKTSNEMKETLRKAIPGVKIDGK